MSANTLATTLIKTYFSSITTPTTASTTITNTNNNVNMTTQPTALTSVVATGELLERLTAEQQRENVVVVGVLAVVIIVGLVGNVLVLAVYRRRPGGAAAPSPAVLFILVMAGLDVASCLLTVPYEILDLMMPYRNDNVQLCQAFRFLTTVLSQSRGMMLLCVALDRYFKICLPLNNYSYRHAKVAVVIVLLIGVALAWPQIVLNGLVTIATHVPHVLGTDCNIVRHYPPVYSLVYHVLMYGVFVVFFVAYAFLYGRIFYVLWRKGWFESSPPPPHPPPIHQPPAGRGLGKKELAAAGARRSLKPGKELVIRRVGGAGSGRSGDRLASGRQLSQRACSDDDSDDTGCDGIPACMKIICPSVGSCYSDADLAGKVLTLDTFAFRETESSSDDFLVEKELSKSSVRFADAPLTLSPEHFVKSRKSLDGYPCRFLMVNPLLNDEESQQTVCYGAIKYKEKHPRAIYRCRQAQNLSTQEQITPTPDPGNKESRKQTHIRRSNSEPCCCVTDTRLARPCLKQSGTCNNVIENWHSAVVGRETNSDAAKTSGNTDYSEAQSLYQITESPVKNAALTCTVFETNYQKKLGLPPLSSETKRRANNKGRAMAERDVVVNSIGPQNAALRYVQILQRKDRIDSCKISLCEAADSDDEAAIPDCRKAEPLHCQPDGELCEAASFGVPADVQRSCSDGPKTVDSTQCATIQPSVHSMKRSDPSQNIFILTECAYATEGHHFEQKTDDSVLYVIKNRVCEDVEGTETSDRPGCSSTKSCHKSSQDEAINASKNRDVKVSLVQNGSNCREGSSEFQTSHGFTSALNERDVQDTTNKCKEITLDLTTESLNAYLLPSTTSLQGGSASATDATTTTTTTTTTAATTTITGCATTASTSTAAVRTDSATTGGTTTATTATTTASPTTPTATSSSATPSPPAQPPPANTDHRAASPTNKGHIRRHGGKRLRMGKTTLMLAMVTLSAVLGFVPFLTVIVMRTSGAKFTDNTSSTGDLVYMFCIRSYLISNVINPFVYFYVNPRFRQKVLRVLRCVCQFFLKLKHSHQHSETSAPRSDT